MLTLEQKNNNEIKFMELLAKLNIDLTNITKLLDSVDYFNKPASTQYSGAYAGGLCEYALRFAHELGILCNAYYPGKYSEEDVIKVALFKDIYKATMYEAYQKNVKDDTTGQWTTVPAYKTKEGISRPVFGDFALSSYFQIKNFISLTDEQSLAIIHSTGNFPPDIHDVMRTYPLVALTRMAEIATTHLY
jgi:hypothetical protein